MGSRASSSRADVRSSVRVCFGPAGYPARLPPPPGLEAIAAEFPTVTLEPRTTAAVTVHAGAWQRGEVDVYALDHRVNELAAQGVVTICVVGAPVLATVMEVLTRCQRWVGRRNHSSAGPVFDRVLALHTWLHDLQKPLVRADYDHALDAWQWVLRLRPRAGAAAQIAALFHDIERLVSEADARVEHLAEDYDGFKRAHAAGGARITREVLDALGLEDALCAQVTRLIEAHDHPHARPHAGQARDPDVALLDDADGLSFFSLNSAGFLDYYGPAHARRKIAWTLARLSAGARARLTQLWLRPDVARLVQEATGSSAVAGAMKRTGQRG